MSPPARLPPQLRGIAAVERDTGISKDTLRIWERRYGFPAPHRDAQGERLYSDDQVHRLRLLKRLVDAGHRPSRVVGATAEVIDALIAAPSPSGKAPVVPSGPEAAAEQARLMALLTAHDIDGFQRVLAQALMRMGLRDCVLDLVAPMTVQVGEEWARGRFEIFEEHVYTENVQQVLRQAIHAMPRAAIEQRPRVLLSTLPGEQHALGLLMAEVLMRLEGAQCVSLGVQTPVQDLILAAAAHRADIVALSFGGSLSPSAVLDGLRQLRQGLAPVCELWAGGTADALRRRPVTQLDVRRIQSLREIGGDMARWSVAHLIA